ncbi:MAG: hypothetical protein VYC39_08930 [Myxococcota bacterium]|nr:hypothetical protein [Myxococcota bacterium]
MTSLGGIVMAANLVLLAPIPEEMVERIQGQVSDLNWQVTRLSSTPQSAAKPWLSIQSRTASITVDIAVWVETSTQNVSRLSIYEPSTGQLKVRAMRGTTKLPAAKLSANYEALALAIRGHLQAFEMRTRMVSLSPPKRIEVRVDKPKERLKPPVPRSTYWETRMAPLYVLQSTESFQDVGIQFGLAWGQEHWALAFKSAWVLPVELADEYSKLSIWSAQAQLGTEWIPYRSSSNSISLSFQSGPQVYVGQVETVLATVQTDEVEPVWALRSAIGAAWTSYFNDLSEGWGLRLGLELGFVAGAPVYKYQSQETVIARSEVWVFQPQLSVGLTYRKKNN